MRKFAAVLAFLLPLFSAQAESDPPRLAAIAEAGVSCVLSADKVGADVKRFSAEGGWVAADDGKSVKHKVYPIAVTLLQDADGVARTCEVRATMASQSDQKEMLAALEVLLRKKPIKQTNSIIWMFGSPPNARGLQYFPDYQNELPEIRFVGAAF
ncbi:MAG: hypothetical protein SFV20_11390 [Sphingopyxis sp.]|nr:hypothetical protein [Sphingopyxis sp.]